MTITPEMVIVVSFLLINLLVGIYYGTGIKTVQKYAIGDRNFNSISIGATIAATYISGDLFMAYVAETYKEGFFFIAAALSGVICLLIIGWLLGPKMNEFFGALSVAETMGNLYGKKIRVITALSSLCLATGMTALQIKVFSTIFNYFFSLSSNYAVLISSLVVIIYSAFGGIKSVTFTDIIQFFTFGVFIPLLALFLYQAFSSPQLILNTLENNEAFNYRQLLNPHNPKFFPNFFIFLWCLIPSLNSTIFQRILMAKDIKQIRQSFTIAAIICLFLLLLICSIGLIIASYAPNLKHDDIIIHAIKDCQFLWIKSFVIIGIMAMVMSTADSWINTASIIITNDLCKSLRINLTNKLIFTRIAAVTVGVSAILLALQASNLLKMALFSASFYMPIVTVPLLLSILGFRSTPRAVLTGMLSGGATVAFWGIVFPNTSIDKVIPAMFVNLITLLLVHYLLREPGGWTKNRNNIMNKGEQDNKKIFSSILISFKAYRQKINSFNLIKYCRAYSPSMDVVYIYTGLYMLVTILNTLLFDKNLYQRYGYSNIIIQTIILLSSSSLIFHNIWSKNFKEKYLALIWHFSIFITLGVIGNILVIVSGYSEISLIILIVNFSIIGILLRWQESIMVILASFLLASIYHYFVASEAPNFYYQYNIGFKIFIITLLFIGIITAFIKPLQEEFISEALLRKKLEKMCLDLRTSYTNAKNIIETNNELANLLDKSTKCEKEFVKLEVKCLKIQQVKHLLKNETYNLNQQVPIVVFGQEKEIVNIKVCLENAVTFISFLAKKAKVSIKVECNIGNISLDLSKASLYQLIFSYIFNSLELIPEGKKMDIKAGLDKGNFYIRVDYLGFGLSIDDLVTYTRNKNYINPFLLNWKNLLEILRYNNFSFDIIKKNYGGTITITKNLEPEVYYLSNYRKNNLV